MSMRGLDPQGLLSRQTRRRRPAGRRPAGRTGRGPAGSERAGPVRGAAGLAALLCLLLSCSPQEEASTRPDGDPPQVGIASPAAGEEVADTVRVTVAVTDAGGIHCVTLLADSLACATRYGAPWTLLWPTGALGDSSWHLLQAEAIDRAGNRALSSPVRVCVRRNAPPRVRILFPRAEQYLSLDDTTASWRCRATDADEGELSGQSIAWSLDGEPLDLHGAIVQPPRLAPGPHRIEARARDRWGRASEATSRVVAFRYPPCDDPAAALEAWLLALRAGDAARAAEVLHSRFRAPAPGAWAPPARDGRAAEALALARLLAPPTLESLEIGAAVGRAEVFLAGDREIAKIELSDLAIRVALACPDPLESVTREWRVAGSRARVFLQREPSEGGAWRLRSWWDLHGAAPGRAAGPSWSALKQAALHDRLCD